MEEVVSDPIDLDQFTTLVDEAYSSAVFAKLSGVWQRALSEHMREMLSGESTVLNWQAPGTAVAAAERFLDVDSSLSPEERQLQFAALLGTMLASGQNLHNPRYIGHQVPASIPIAGLFDAVGSITNQPMAIFEMGPWATAVEHALIRRLCVRVGWNPETSSGVLTHGGSLANLTALLTARNVTFPKCWEEGVPPNAVIIAHADAHYCVTRAAGILGLGTRQIVKAKLDEYRRINATQLAQTIAECRAAGQTVIAVAAAACATPIGAFDPLDDIADVCEQLNVWLHVDAAHGGGVLMSPRHRRLLAGIDRADSVVWDAHKMMFMPALCAAVLYRNRDHRFAAFEQDAPYLFDPTDAGMAEYDSGTRTIECTKRPVGFGLWGLWSMYGDDIFAELVDRTFALAGHVHSLVEAADDFQAMHRPECNIVVFRHVPEQIASMSRPAQNQFQQQLRTRLIREGEFFIVQTKLDGVACLRLTVMNPTTTTADLELLLQRIRETGDQVLAAPIAAPEA